MDGISLRDWFAGQAMAGILAADTEFITAPSEVAEVSYMQADAMIAARATVRQPLPPTTSDVMGDPMAGL